ncbi:MAG: hypothetical protein HY271_19335 [Deltaproteobacteria bacterium]|nr:hypothetical protein [Deltaproteobacteria bacterium]
MLLAGWLLLVPPYRDPMKEVTLPKSNYSTEELLQRAKELGIDVSPPAGVIAREYQLDPPVAEWNQVSAHDTAKGCEAARLQLNGAGESQLIARLWQRLGYRSSPWTFTTYQARGARCVPAEHIYSPAK